MGFKYVKIGFQEKAVVFFIYQAWNCNLSHTITHKIYEVYKGNNKITELRTILQRESQNS